MSDPTARPEAIRIGVSSCLLGEEVRFDGGHKRDRYLTDTLAAHVEWVPVCPEVEFGLGTPREPIHLIRIGDEIRLRTVRSGADLTARMRAYARARVAALEREDLSGYLLKNNSPSCGMERVRVHQAKGPPRKDGRGLFASALIERFPDLPVEEEGRLSDPRLRENWIERVFAYRALRELWSRRWTVGDLVRFHGRHKLVLLAHSPAGLRELGRLVAAARDVPRPELRRRYADGFMSALARIATVGKNANVLQHILGFFKKDLDAASRQELLDHVEDYRRGLVPLVVPLTLVRHHVRIRAVPYLADQVYLNPHPEELALRNHV
jgi:uncharacterized protein YbgA (DUF1722 family)/uncharacterized protein YbbK (DUF523 family)